jgi:hypothetical protein
VRKRTWSAAAIAAMDKNLADWLPPLGDSAGIAGGPERRPERSATGFRPT